MSMTPTPDSSSAPASTAILAQVGPPATAVRASGAGNSAAPTIAVRPSPIRRDRRGATAAPATAPKAPIPKARPMALADRSSSLLAYNTSSALAMKVKKLTVAVQPSAARSTGCRSTSASPSRTSAIVDDRDGGSGGSVTGIRPINTAEARNDTASATSAMGAVNACTRVPPTAGPMTKDPARLRLSLLLAST
jgi:hypothetical protein